MALLSPTPTPFAPLELTVPTSAHTKVQMVVDSDALWWDGYLIDLERVAAVAYSARPRRHRGVVRRVSRVIRLWTGVGEPFEIELDGGSLGRSLEQPQLAAYAAITSALYAGAEPRLRSELLRGMAAGEEIPIGQWRLDRRGMHDSTGLSVAWEHLPAAVLDGEVVAITHRLECGRVEHRRVSMLTPNAVLLPELLDDAAVVFA